eukprot:3244595-Prymnesium_polylepis.1
MHTLVAILRIEQRTEEAQPAAHVVQVKTAVCDNAARAGRELMPLDGDIRLALEPAQLLPLLHRYKSSELARAHVDRPGVQHPPILSELLMAEVGALCPLRLLLLPEVRTKALKDHGRVCSSPHEVA